MADNNMNNTKENINGAPQGARFASGPNNRPARAPKRETESTKVVAPKREGTEAKARAPKREGAETKARPARSSGASSAQRKNAQNLTAAQKAAADRKRVNQGDVKATELTEEQKKARAAAIRRKKMAQEQAHEREELKRRAIAARESSNEDGEEKKIKRPQANKTNKAKKVSKFNGMSLLNILWSIIINGIIVFALIECYLFSYNFAFQVFTDTSYSPADKSQKTVEILADSSTLDVVNQLSDEGLVGDKNVLLVKVVVGGYRSKIQAGTYVLSPSMTTSEILDVITGNGPDEGEE